jgi:hypothetical protein
MEEVDPWKQMDINLHLPKDISIGGESLQDLMYGDQDDIVVEELPRYQDVIEDSPAHEWFIGRIEQEITTNSPSSAARLGDIIFAEMSSMGPFQRIDQYQNPVHCTVEFSMLWDPVGFVRTQVSEVRYDAHVEQAIALTGDRNDAEATTIKQYLHRCWPSVATSLLDALHDLSDPVLKGNLLLISIWELQKPSTN